MRTGGEVGMTNRETVIVELTDSIEILSDFDTQEYTFRERQQLHGSVIAAIQDTLELLKAQEPRVMTLNEVKQHNNQDGCVWFEQPTYNAVAAFVRKEDFEIEVISPYILGEPINHGYWTNSNYGKTWRCWTARPDQATREATPWERSN